MVRKKEAMIREIRTPRISSFNQQLPQMDADMLRTLKINMVRNPCSCSKRRRRNSEDAVLVVLLAAQSYQTITPSSPESS
jgi:hypothetical protein